MTKGKVERTRSKNAERERKVKLKLLLTNFTWESELIAIKLCLHLQLILKSPGCPGSSSVQQKFLIFYETLRRIYVVQHFNYKPQIKKNELYSHRANGAAIYADMLFGICILFDQFYGVVTHLSGIVDSGWPIVALILNSDWSVVGLSGQSLLFCLFHHFDGNFNANSH